MTNYGTNRRRRRGAFAGRPGVEALEARVALSGGVTPTLSADGVLRVVGTAGSDVVQVFRAGGGDSARVVADGRGLGRFVGVRRIVVEGGDGDDFIKVGLGVKSPTTLSGGAGDDRIRGGGGSDTISGGAGDDTLIGGRGYDSLHGGAGRNKILAAESMGVIRVGASVSGDALRLLRGSYTLRRVGPRGAANAPLVVGTADLADAALAATLKSAYETGRPIGLTGASKAGAARLEAILGHPMSANLADADPPADLVVFRRATRADGESNFVSAVLKRRVPAASGSGAGVGGRVADQGAAAWLSRTLAGVPIDPAPPSVGDSPQNDLTKLASSYYQSTLGTGGEGDQLQLTNTIWNVRSFGNGNDFYYVAQGIEATYGDDIPDHPLAQVVNELNATSQAPTIIDPAPQTTQISTTYTHGLTWNIGGSVGYNQTQGVNGALSGGVAVSDSTSYTVPPVVVSFSANLQAGSPQWEYVSDPVPTYSTLTFDNDWIWVVPQTAYSTGQTKVQVGGSAILADYINHVLYGKTLVSVSLNYQIPTPFGDVYSFQQPVVSGTNVSSVESGSNFVVEGSGFYPSLVSAVELGGSVLTAQQYNVLSDTQIEVTAPYFPGYQSIVVQTQVGRSNSDKTIYIDYF